MTRVDVHQHRWSEPLVALLAAREAAPRMRRRGGSWWLELEDEPPSAIDVDGDAVGRRLALLADDGMQRALLAHSPALGLDALPVEDARAIAAAHAEGCRGLPDAFGWWAALPLAGAAAADVDAALDAGAVGLCLPSGALARPSAVAALAPLLTALETAGAPLFVHPGPGPRPDAGVIPAVATASGAGVLAPYQRQGVGMAPTARAAGDDGGETVPGWWPALGAYVPGMHVAWHAWVAAAGRDRHPRLRILWAMLAGLAPLHHERLAARGGPAAAAVRDPLAFYDTSSYGPQAQRAMVDAVGIDQLVHGSDRPVIAPPPSPGPLGPDAWDALTVLNPARLLGPAGTRET